MNDLANTGADAPADDLRSEIENAFKASSEPEAPQVTDPAALPASDASALPDTKLTTPTGERPRDDQGRFTKAEQAAQANAAVTDATKAITQAVQQPAAVDPAAARPVGPPPGWSPTSKAAFDALPDPVKKDIAKREEEISQGFAKLAEYKGLDPYVEQARSNGTTLPQALENYVAAENLLDSNPINGMLWLCERYQVHPAQLLEAIGQGQGYQQPDPSADPMAPIISHIQTLNSRLSQFEGMQSQAQDQFISEQIKAFGSDPANKYFANVKKDMGRIIAMADQQGQELTLTQAYEQACWANPEIRGLLIKDQIATQEADKQRKADEARRAAGSLPTGSPIPGGTLSSGEPASTLRGEIERAFADARI